MKIERTTKLLLEGKGEVSLSPGSHMATGGEGSVYKLPGNTVVKLYTDPEKMRKDGMPERIRRLSALRHDYVVAPQGVVFIKNQPVGLYMPYVDGGLALTEVFTNTFRETTKWFDDKMTAIFADRMRETIQFALDHQALPIDPNELSWFAMLAPRKKDATPRFIDVDSWVFEDNIPDKVPKMPSIQDPHSANASRESVWYALGIVLFQLFTNLHPYKGKLAGYSPNEWRKRMEDNASVFTPGIKGLGGVRDFSCMPPVFLNWSIATFQKGERSPIPSMFAPVTVLAKPAMVARVVVTATGRLAYTKLFGKPGDPVTRIFSCGIALLESGKLVDLAKNRMIGTVTSRECEIVKVGNDWLKAQKGTGQQWLYSCINGLSLKEEPLNLAQIGYGLLRYENRLFLVTDQGLTELLLKQYGKPVLSVGQTWGATAHSTRWFDGVGVMDAMGATFLVAPFGDDSCVQRRVKELDGLRPVTAKAGNRFIVVISVNRNGEYRKSTLTFEKDYASYRYTEEGVQTSDLNATLLPKGVVASIEDDGELIIFVPTSGETNRISDKDITTRKILGNWDNTVVYIHDGDVWSMKVNPKTA